MQTKPYQPIVLGQLPAAWTLPEPVTKPEWFGYSLSIGTNVAAVSCGPFKVIIGISQTLLYIMNMGEEITLGDLHRILNTALAHHPQYFSDSLENHYQWGYQHATADAESENQVKKESHDQSDSTAATRDFERHHPQ